MALDQLIFELAFMDSRAGKRLSGKQSLGRTMFPASDTLVNFESHHVCYTLLAGITKQHRAQLKRFQPYRSRNYPGVHPLRLLHDLSNDDKHRLTQPVLLCPHTISLDVPGEDEVVHACLDVLHHRDRHRPGRGEVEAEPARGVLGACLRGRLRTAAALRRGRQVWRH